MAKRVSKKRIHQAISIALNSYATHKDFTIAEWLESNHILKYNKKAKDEFKGILNEDKKQ